MSTSKIAEEKVMRLEDLEKSIELTKHKLIELRQQYNKVEKDLYYIMKAMPLGSFVTGNNLSAVVNKQTVCSILDWDKFLIYVVDNNKTNLIHKSINNQLYAKLLRKGIVPPGSQPYKKLGVELVNKKEVTN